MTETFAALLLAHAVADYLLQPARWIETKRHPLTLVKHSAVVWLASMAATGSLHWSVLALALAHLAVDAAKVYLTPPAALSGYLADQTAHLATIFALALLVPGLWSGGIWAAAPAELPVAMAAAAGLILATRAGQFAVGFMMSAHTPDELTEGGLPRGGETIGLLERGLIFLLILAGELGAIGFLIAAKSVLRFGTVHESRAASEYVIIGTLASFGWAISVALATRWLIDALPGA